MALDIDSYADGELLLPLPIYLLLYHLIHSTLPSAGYAANVRAQPVVAILICGNTCGVFRNYSIFLVVAGLVCALSLASCPQGLVLYPGDHGGPHNILNTFLRTLTPHTSCMSCSLTFAADVVAYAFLPIPYIIDIGRPALGSHDAELTVVVNCADATRVVFHDLFDGCRVQVVSVDALDSLSTAPSTMCAFDGEVFTCSFMPLYENSPRPRSQQCILR